MINKRLVGYCLLLLIAFNSLQFSSAITASIGNSRMVLRIGPGESVERTILVKNVNDVPVNINISVSGDLAETVKIKQNDFELQSGGEKTVHFTIMAKEAGRTETNINIGFKPEEGNGAGLSSNIVVIADEKYKGEESNIFEDLIEEKKDDIKDSDSIVDNKEVKNEKIGNRIDASILIVLTVFLAAILIALYFYYLTTKSKKSVTKINE